MMIRLRWYGAAIGKQLVRGSAAALVLGVVTAGSAGAQSFTGIGDLAANPPFSSAAYAVSPDGTKVTGVATVGDTDDGAPNTQAFIWSAGSGMTALAPLGDSIYYGEGHGITNSGVVAGYGDSLDPVYFYQAGTPIRWSPAPMALPKLGEGEIWNNDSYLLGSNAVDGSGNVIVGYISDFDEAGNDRAFVWVNGTPRPLDWLHPSDPPPTIYVDYLYSGGVNTPGTHIVGTSFNFSADDGFANGEAVLWTDATAQWTSAAARTPVGLGFLPGISSTADGSQSGANDVSNNGQVVVGSGKTGFINPTIPEADPQNGGRFGQLGFITLGVPGGVPNPMAALADLGANNGTTDLQFAAAAAVNGGATVTSYTAVGWGYNGLENDGPDTDEDGEGTADTDVDVSFDASDLNREAVMWTTAGVQNIESVATGLGLNLTGWDLQEATAVSDNGRVIVGWGTNPLGNTEGWVLTLPGVQIPGDFNNNGVVNGADFTKWKGDFGPGNGSDADGDGDSDGADYLAWQRNFNPAAAVASVEAVPEPAAGALAWVAGCVLAGASFRRHNELVRR